MDRSSTTKTAANWREPGLWAAPALSPRELKILTSVAEGQSVGMVAERLDMTASTVRTYLQRIRRKYAEVNRPASSKAELVVRAIQDGYLDINDV